MTDALETDAEVMRHLGGPAEMARSQHVHERRLGGSPTEWFRTILADPDDAPAGVIAVFESTWQGSTIAELGIMLLPDRGQRHGLAVVAVRQIVAEVQASGRVPRIHAFIGVDNRAAGAVARRTGFRSGGTYDLEYEGVPIRCDHWTVEL